MSQDVSSKANPAYDNNHDALGMQDHLGYRSKSKEENPISEERNNNTLNTFIESKRAD